MVIPIDSLKIIGLLLCLSACSEPFSNEQSSFTFPLLSECKNSVEQHRDFFSEFSRSRYTVTEFDHKLPSHPNVIGYVHITSTHDSEDSLKSEANTIFADCYPDSKITVSKSEVSRVLEQTELLGAPRSYIVVGPDDNIQVYVHQGIYSKDEKQSSIELPEKFRGENSKLFPAPGISLNGKD